MAETVWKCPHLEKYFIFFPVLLLIWCVIFRRFIISREFHGRWIYDPLRGGRNSTVPISHFRICKKEIPCSPRLRVSSCFLPVSERLRFDFRFFFGMKRLFRPKVSATKTGKVVCCRIKARSLVGSEIRSNDYHNLPKILNAFENSLLGPKTWQFKISSAVTWLPRKNTSQRSVGTFLAFFPHALMHGAVEVSSSSLPRRLFRTSKMRSFPFPHG